MVSNDTTMAGPEARDHILWHLSRLVDELDERGYLLQLEHVQAPLPRLWVRDERIDQRIFALPVDGVWWFWWPWVERIVECRDVATAADRICATARVQA